MNLKPVKLLIAAAQLADFGTADKVFSCRFGPDSRYLRVQFAKKMQFVSEFEVPMPLLVASNVVKSGFIGTIG